MRVNLALDDGAGREVERLVVRQLDFSAFGFVDAGPVIDDVGIVGVRNVFFRRIDEDEKRMFSTVVLDGELARFIDVDGE